MKSKLFEGQVIKSALQSGDPRNFRRQNDRLGLRLPFLGPAYYKSLPKIKHKSIKSSNNYKTDYILIVIPEI